MNVSIPQRCHRLGNSQVWQLEFPMVCSLFGSAVIGSPPFSDVWSEYYCLARGNHFVARVLVWGKRGKVCLVQRGRGCNVCVFTLCCFLAEFVRLSLMLVGNIKVVEGEVRWRRSKGVFRNWVFYLFRNSESAMRGHQFIAVSGNLLFSLTLYFLRQHKWITKLFFNNATTKVFYLQLWIWFAFGAARLVVFRLVSVGDEMA